MLWSINLTILGTELLRRSLHHSCVLLLVQQHCLVIKLLAGRFIDYLELVSGDFGVGVRQDCPFVSVVYV